MKKIFTSLAVMTVASFRNSSQVHVCPEGEIYIVTVDPSTGCQTGKCMDKKELIQEKSKA